jgi:hypothetical protein
MFNLRSVFAFWAILALFLGSAGPAQAQATGSITITVPATGVRREHQDYAGKVPVSQINYKDCLSEDAFTFTVNLGPTFAQYSLQVWAGEACDVRTNRVGATQSCWRVGGGQPTTIIFSNLRVPIRDLLSGRTGGANIGTGGTGGTGGTDSSGGTSGGGDTGGTDGSSGGSGGSGATSNQPSSGPTECNTTSTAVSAQTLNLFFLMVDGGENAAGTATFKTTYKLNAPAPPTNVASGVGENIAPISWTTTASADTSIDGYQLYCDPAPGQAGLDEAGIIADPDVLPGSCTASTILVPGARPDDKYKCGTAAKTATKSSATGLINNVAYNVSVAATDTYRNVGVVSTPPACAIPQPVTGFFEAYRDAGGEGGGGYCSFSRQRRPMMLLTVLGLGLCLMLRRRRAT